MQKALALLKREPALALGVLCGAAVWALTRYLGVDPSAAQQAVYGVVPVLFAAVTRQYVTPVHVDLGAVAGVLVEGPSLVEELKTVIAHPAVMGQILDAIKAELRAIAAEAPTPAADASVDVPAAPAADAAPVPPLIPSST